MGAVVGRGTFTANCVSKGSVRSMANGKWRKFAGRFEQAILDERDEGVASPNTAGVGDPGYI